MYTLYLLSGSRHSEEAKDLLSSSEIQFELRSLSDSDQLSGIFFDLGIRELPALVSGSTMAEGLENIRTYISTAGREQADST